MTTQTQATIIAGSRVFWAGSNCDVVRVFANTVTLRCWGKGLREGRLVTFRGISKMDLEPKKSIEELKAIGAW